MIIEGIITKILREEKGISKDGKAWRKANFLLTSTDGHQTQSKFDVIGEERIRRLNLQIGQNVKLVGSIESREFNDRWYSDVHIWSHYTEEDKPAIHPVQANPLF